MECISKGNARNPYEFGVKVSLAVTHKQGLIVGGRSFPGNPYDGHVLNAQLEQTTNLLQDTGRSPQQVIVDLGYRGVDGDNPGVQIIHRGKYQSLSEHERRLLKRRQAIEPLFGHTKTGHRMDRCCGRPAKPRRSPNLTPLCSPESDPPSAGWRQLPWLGVLPHEGMLPGPWLSLDDEFGCWMISFFVSRPLPGRRRRPG